MIVDINKHRLACVVMYHCLLPDWYIVGEVSMLSHR